MAQPKAVRGQSYKLACHEGTAVKPVGQRHAAESGISVLHDACIKHGKDNEKQSVGDSLHSRISAASNSMRSVVLTL